MFKPKLAIQLYTLRDYIQTAEDFDRTLERLQTLGVRDVQISAIGDIPVQTQKEILDRHNMQVCVTHKSYDWMREEPEAVVAHHQVLGCDAIGMGAAPIDVRWNTRLVREFIDTVQTFSRVFAANGMSFHYHNHAFEYNRLDDFKGCMMDLLLEETDPELFRFIPDLAWMHYAGKDPVKQLRKMAGRVKVVHFKDYVFDHNGYRRFVTLGEGLVDLRACYEAACALEIPYIAYEQDSDWIDGDPFRSVEASWAYMQKLQS